MNVQRNGLDAIANPAADCNFYPMHPRLSADGNRNNGGPAPQFKAAPLEAVVTEATL